MNPIRFGIISPVAQQLVTAATNIINGQDGPGTRLDSIQKAPHSDISVHVTETVLNLARTAQILDTLA